MPQGNTRLFTRITMSTMTALVNGHEIHSPRGRDVEQLPRSASYTCVPILTEGTAYSRGRKQPSLPITIKGSFSEDDLIASADDGGSVSPPESSGWTTPNEELRIHSTSLHTDSAQDLVAELHKSPKISVSRYASSNEDETSTCSQPDGSTGLDPAEMFNAVPAVVSSAPATAPVSPVLSTIGPVGTRPPLRADRLQASSFAKRLSRKLSYSPSSPSSRSPSPSAGPEAGDHEAAPSPPPVGAVIQQPPTRKRTILKKRDGESGDGKSSGLLSRSGTLLRRKSKAPKPSNIEPAVKASMEATRSGPSVPTLPKSFSTDRLPYASHVHRERPMPMPRPMSGDKISSLGALAHPRKRDELWGVFRSLDGDYTKCVSALLAHAVVPC